jgi:hypothetical protein
MPEVGESDGLCPGVELNRTPRELHFPTGWAFPFRGAEGDWEARRLGGWESGRLGGWEAGRLGSGKLGGSGKAVSSDSPGKAGSEECEPLPIAHCAWAMGKRGKGEKGKRDLGDVPNGIEA